MVKFHDFCRNVGLQRIEVVRKVRQGVLQPRRGATQGGHPGPRTGSKRLTLRKGSAQCLRFARVVENWPRSEGMLKQHSTLKIFQMTHCISHTTIYRKYKRTTVCRVSQLHSLKSHLLRVDKKAVCNILPSKKMAYNSPENRFYKGTRQKILKQKCFCRHQLMYFKWDLLSLKDFLNGKYYHMVLCNDSNDGKEIEKY